MAKYLFKNGKLPNSLNKYKTAPENPETAPVIEEDETEQAAFFSGEEATKVISTTQKNEEEPVETPDAPEDESDSEEDSFFNPFEDEEDEKTQSRNILKSFLVGSKKNKHASEEVLDEVDEIYTNASVKDVDETMETGSKVSLSEIFGDKKKKKKKKSKNSETDGEHDEYEVNGTAIEDIYESVSDDIEEDEEDEDYDSGKKEDFREFISPDEKDEFYQNYRRSSRKALLSVLSTLVFTLLLFFLESPAFPHPKFLTPGRFGILYLLVDLQLLFLTGVCILNRLIRGAKALFKWAPTKNSITFLIFAVSTLQILIHLFVDRYNENIVLFSSIAALCAFINAISHFFDVRREGISFRMAATDSVKYVADNLSEDSAEHNFFNQYLPEEPCMYSLTQTKFVSKFVATSRANSSFNEMYKILIPLVVFTSVIFAVVANIMAGVPTFGRALDNFTLALMISTPLASFFTVTLPFFKGTLKMAKRGCTVIGESSLDSCSSVSVISFKDTEAFHEKGIKVTSVKTYGDARIDTAIFTAARVFNIVGGPLKAVFNRSIIAPGSSGSSENDTVLQISPSSILSIIDNKKIVLGTSVAMESIGLECPIDPVDDMFITSGGRIMYMCANEVIAAKFYIKYSLGKNFKALLDTFYDIGICMSIKSCDPNLDTEYLTKLLKDKNYPIVVIKQESNDNTISVSTPSGIVSNTSIPNLLRSFLWCDKCRRIISLNNLAKYIGIIISLVILVVCLLNANSHEKITPLIVMIYQLIWTVPILGTSLFQ